MRNIQNINIRYGSGVPVPCDLDYLLKMHEELYNNLQKDANGEFLETEIKCIESVLSYKRYISQNKEMSYALAKLMDSNTCTYWNSYN